MKILEINEQFVVCEDCLFTERVQDGLAKLNGLSHPHAQFDDAHPLKECFGTLRTINLFEYVNRARESERIDASIERAINQMKLIDDSARHDHQLLESIAGRIRFGVLSKEIRRTIQKLPQSASDAKISFRAEIASLKLNPDFDSAFVKENRVVAEKIMEAITRWDEWKSSNKLQKSPETNYVFLPYPDSSDLDKLFLCSNCDSQVAVENIEKPRIVKHTDPETDDFCINSMVELTQHDLCTISSNCNNSKMKLKSEITAISLDPSKFGQPVILQDGTVVEYGTRPHIDALNSNEKPERPY